MNQDHPKLDVLVLSVHPDDAELGCSGTLLNEIHQGKKVGIIDLTRGELGSRGSAEIRDREAAASSKILGLTVRENLHMRDGFFANDEENQLKIIQVIRHYQPDIVITNALLDRHPDHGRAGDLANDALFLSGLRRIESRDHSGNLQEAFRPRLVLQMIQDYYIKPDIVIDVTAVWPQKIESIHAFGSQFFNPDYVGEGDEPQTYISNPDFLQYIEARAMEFGKYIGVKYGEGFTCRRLLGVSSVSDLL